MNLEEKIAEKYSRFLKKVPGIFLIVMIALSLGIASFASNVETVEQQTEDFLPESEPVISAFNALDAEFASAGGTNYVILIQPEPSYGNSSEIRDVRNPEFLRYVETITNEMNSLQKVTDVSSPSNLFKDIPSSKQGVQNALNQMGEPRWSQSIASDFSAVKIQATSSGLTSEEQSQVADNLRNSIQAQEMSSTLDISYTGQLYIDEAFQNQSQESQSLTGILSLVGVALVVIILFRSIYYGLNSLLTVVFGLAVGFGIYGLLGLNITPQTSGSISLGIGIAVDFGIQPIARYREEREGREIKEAIKHTLLSVATPMTVGLIAANIGFLALAFGKLTFLSDLGYLLALTTTFAYVAALTIIPAALIFHDKYISSRIPSIHLKKLYYKVTKQS
jgi:predicted RND superfamily exporter protein